jgi:hypothetical protein
VVSPQRRYCIQDVGNLNQQRLTRVAAADGGKDTFPQNVYFGTPLSVLEGRVQPSPGLQRGGASCRGGRVEQIVLLAAHDQSIHQPPHFLVQMMLQNKEAILLKYLQKQTHKNTQIHI